MPATEIFYLVYSTANNREFLSHCYNTSTNTFTVVDDSHVKIISEANLFEIKIDGEVALRIEDGIFKATKFSAKGFFNDVKVHFYRKRKSFPDRLATLTRNGLFVVGKIRTHHGTCTYRNRESYRTGHGYRGQLVWPANGFRFKNDGNYVAMISANGLQAVDIKQGLS